MNIKIKVDGIIKEFDKLYRDAKCTLDYEDALQLLVATQLSAQCTDARVNIVTKTLFQKYKSVNDFANADFDELAGDIRPTGFYNNKARNIKNCCIMLIENYSGKIPESLEDLVNLPGVGRKTANLVLGEIFNIPGIVVDTHAKRLSNRIGLSGKEDPVKIEFDLMKIIPKNKWRVFSHQLVCHGREVCNARKPKCELCSINSLCDYYKNNVKKA
ncbi:MAG: endonuclease III [Clostridia bacterium]|jgi:endonuclease-3